MKPIDLTIQNQLMITEEHSFPITPIPDTHSGCRVVVATRGRVFTRCFYLFVCMTLLIACTPATTPQPTPDMDAAITQVVATIQAGATLTAQYTPPTSIPSETPVPQPTAIRTPPALPDNFSTTLLNPLDIPHIYIQDTCQALDRKSTRLNSSH